MIHALLVGAGLGLLALFPGFHFALLVLAAGPWFLAQFGLADGLLGLVTAITVARAMHTLAVVYHPVAADQLASADPAQRLAAAGQDQFATRLLGDGLWLGTAVTVGLVGVATFLSQVYNFPFLKWAIGLLAWAVVPMFVFWFGFTLYKAKNRLSTLVVVLAAGVLGIIALDHPAVRGSAHSMTPLLTGLFGLPVLLLVLGQKAHSVLTLGRTRQQRSLERDPPGELTLAGLGIGLLSVALPGLGTSSLVTLAQDWAEDDAQYLKMAALAETTAEMLALCLGILGLAQRSSDIAAITKVTSAAGHPEWVLGPVFPYAMLATLLGACGVGLVLVKVLGAPYRWGIKHVPQKLQAIVVAAGMVWVVWSHTGEWGLAIMLVGTLIHLGARQLRVPNQAFFACIVAPLALSMFEITIF